MSDDTGKKPGFRKDGGYQATRRVNPDNVRPPKGGDAVKPPSPPPPPAQPASGASDDK